MNVSALYHLQTEVQWLAQVRRIAERHGFLSYHTRNSKGSDKGFPDLVLVRPPRGGRRGRVIFAELKSERGYLYTEQIEWLTALWSCSGVETYVWKPSNEQSVEQILARAEP